MWFLAVIMLLRWVWRRRLLLFGLHWFGFTFGIPSAIRSDTGTLESLLYLCMLRTMGGKLGPVVSTCVAIRTWTKRGEGLPIFSDSLILELQLTMLAIHGYRQQVGRLCETQHQIRRRGTLEEETWDLIHGRRRSMKRLSERDEHACWHQAAEC